jgi:hypothetical protein
MKGITMYTSAYRTNSPRQRAGSRRNKKLRNVHTFASDLTHTQRWGCSGTRGHLCPRYAPMAIALSACEQVWVDDVRARRDHVHQHIIDTAPRVPGATITGALFLEPSSAPVATDPSVLRRALDALKRL